MIISCKNGIYSSILKTGNKIHINESIAETDDDLYNYCRKKKHLVTAIHKNEVRVKTTENDKKCLPVDTRNEADSFANNGFFINHINQWDVKGPPKNSTNDVKKTPYKKRQEAFKSPTNKIQNEVSNQNHKFVNSALSLRTSSQY